MTIRTRIFLLVAVTALLSGLMVYLALDRLLVGSYQELEQKVLSTEIDRARQVIQEESDALTARAGSMAVRDAWEMLLTGRGDAPADVPWMREQDFGVLLALDADGKQKFAMVRNEYSASRDQLTKDVRAGISAILQDATRQDPISVMVETRAGVALVIIQRIRSGAGHSPVMGELVLASLLDDSMAARVAARIHHDFSFVPAAADALPLRLDFSDEQRAWGEFRLDDAAGKPLLLGRVSMPRDIHQQVKQLMGLITLILAVIMLVAPVLVELAIDRFVISRVRQLRDWASAVADGGPLAPPNAVGGGDEVGDLSRSIGSMATHLDGVQKDLELAREQADRASRAKTEFLAGASHEIRTPLTAILGYAELLQDRRLGDDEYFHYLATIRDNGEELLSLLNDVLDLSKIESGRLDLSWEKTDIRAILLGVLNLLEIKASERGLTLQVNGADGLPARAFIDPMRFRQIFVNLVNNAIRYTDHGGITLICRMNHPSPTNAQLTIEVRDTGIGMDTTQMARLFRPFTQLGYGARRSGGTGLGLALSQEFARAMGGSIRVESAPGKGSTFFLELPLGDLSGVPLAGSVPLAPPPIPEPTPLDNETFSGACVLLVEDNPVNCLLVEKLLEKLEVQVHAESDGMIALEHLLKSGERYDLVLLDMRLPSLDGYAIARRLRAADYRGTVVALTASAMTGERERALGAGCDDFIAKPLQASDFLRTCRGWLRRSRNR